MAEAVFQNRVNQAGLSRFFVVDSTAVGEWHLGQRPHPGTQAVLKDKKVPLNPEKGAKLLRAADFSRYAFILAIDQETASDIQSMYGHQVKRLMEFAPEGMPLDVPDPYYDHKFPLVYEMVKAACEGLLNHIRSVEKF